MTRIYNVLTLVMGSGEERARYLRTVYELEPLDRRPQTLFEQIRQIRSELSKPRLMLEDLIQISPRPLPDREKFLTEWIAFLRTQSGSEADAWLREAIRLSQGTPGLATLAQPTLQRLLDLWETVSATEARTALMRQAVQHVRAYMAHSPSHQIDNIMAGDAGKRKSSPGV